MRENNENELKTFAHVSLVTAIVVFSILNFVLNLISGWEKWVLLLLIFAPVISCVMHIKKHPALNSRMRIYVIILIIETFYYCDNIYKIYDAAPVVVMVMILFAMSQEYLFVWLAMFAGYAGMIFHLMEKKAENALKTDNLNVTRTVLHFAIIFLAGILVLSIEKTVRVMRESFEDKIKALKDQNNSASDFLANVSHEIRTPINAVVGLTGVCIEKESDENIKNDLESIASAGQRISDQISDILDYSEIDIEKLAVNEEDYMVSSVVQDIVNKIEPYKSDNIELVIDVEPTLPAVLHSDAAKIKKILIHLILNGLKYTNEGGVFVHITSEKRDYGINLNIEVSDTGIGMNEQELARVFERFYQVNSGITRRAGGLGLGMPITAGFVRALGGFITMDSEPGKGTRVRVSLPQKVVDKSGCMSVDSRNDLVIGSYMNFEKYEHPQVREYYNKMIKDLVVGFKMPLHRVDSIENLRMISKRVKFTHLFMGQEEYEKAPEFIDELAKKMLVYVVSNADYKLSDNSCARIMRKPFYGFPVVSALNLRHDNDLSGHEHLLCPDVRALVVDDEPLNLTVAKGILSKYQMNVTTAVSGTDAVELCRKNEYDIIFMDHMMPGMDGIETVKEIRALSVTRTREMPIVALTANATSTARELFASEGFNGFVSKPIEIIELERVIKSVLPASLMVFEKIKDNASSDNEEDENKGNSSEDNDYENKEPEFEEMLIKAGVNVNSGLAHVQNDMEFYRTLLEQFYDEADKKQEKLKDYYGKSDYKNYEILVHAIKSTAKMIGANELSDKALALEKAANIKDDKFISNNHLQMVNSFTDTVTVIGKAIGKIATDKAVDDTEEDEDEDLFFFEPQGGDGN